MGEVSYEDLRNFRREIETTIDKKIRENNEIVKRNFFESLKRGLEITLSNNRNNEKIGIITYNDEYIGEFPIDNSYYSNYFNNDFDNEYKQTYNQNQKSRFYRLFDNIGLNYVDIKAHNEEEAEEILKRNQRNYPRKPTNKYHLFNKVTREYEDIETDSRDEAYRILEEHEENQRIAEKERQERYEAAKQWDWDEKNVYSHW